MSIKQVRVCDFCGMEIQPTAGPWFWLRIEPDGGNGKDIHVACLASWVGTISANQPIVPGANND